MQEINQTNHGAPIDTVPIDEDPAPSHDGGHTTVPSSTPTDGEQESTLKSNPGTAAAADIHGTGGTAA